MEHLSLADNEVHDRRSLRFTMKRLYIHRAMRTSLPICTKHPLRVPNTILQYYGTRNRYGGC
jgi:hypothetical protein